MFSPEDINQMKNGLAKNESEILARKDDIVSKINENLRKK